MEIQAHVLLHFIRSSNENQALRSISDESNLDRSLSAHLMPTYVDYEAQIAESCKIVSTSYGFFKRESAEQVNDTKFPCSIQLNQVQQAQISVLDMAARLIYLFCYL